MPSSDPSAEQSVRLPLGVALHARPAGAFAVMASRFAADVVLAANGKRANAKSILEVLGLGVTGGELVQLTASGHDAVQAVAELAEFLPQLC